MDYNSMLTEEEKLEVQAEASDREWGFSPIDIREVFDRWEEGDQKEKAKVLYLLKECNYHTLCGKLKKGDEAGAVAWMDAEMPLDDEPISTTISKETTQAPSIEGVTTKGEKAMKKMFIQPTDKMKKALDEEGLNIDWPEGEVDIESFAIDGLFYTGAGDWEKIASIDLRDKEITNAEEADRAIAEELQSSYDNYNVAEEFSIHQDVSGAPEAEELLEDCKEAEARLERFAKVAWAVVRGEHIPPEENEEPNITISLSEAKSIVEMLSVGNPTEEIFKRNERLELMNVLRDKIAEVE